MAEAPGAAGGGQGVRPQGLVQLSPSPVSTAPPADREAWTPDDIAESAATEAPTPARAVALTAALLAVAVVAVADPMLPG